MAHRKVNSLRDIRNLKITPKKANNGVQFTKAGGFVKARLHGRQNCVFGRTREEALARLRTAQSTRKWMLVPLVISPLEQQLMNGLR